MSQSFSKIASVAVALSLLAGIALGTPSQKAKSAAQKTKPAAAVTCPVCHMALSKKKTKDNTVAVRLKKGGPVMYCCAGCKMPASVLVKPAKPAKSKMGTKKA